MQSKKLAFLKALAIKYEYPDAAIVDDIIKGFSLTGMHSKSSVYDHEVTVPRMTVEILRAAAPIQNQAMWARTKLSGSSEVDHQIWDKAMAEVDRGWLLGPFEAIGAISELLGDTPCPSRRFPVVQKTKVRAIDDLSESGVNGTFCSQDKLKLMDADSLCALIRMIENVVVHGVRKIQDHSVSSFRCTSTTIGFAMAGGLSGKAAPWTSKTPTNS